jgi:hypothetical protein
MAIYEEKIHHLGSSDGAYERMQLLEHAIHEDALKDWVTAKSLWVTDFDRLVMLPIIEKMALQALRQTVSEYEVDDVAVQALKRFFVKLNPREMLS